MTVPYRLHYAPDNASLIVRLVLEELGLPYRTILVDRAARAQHGAAYRAINPAGLIPALETPDGPIFETAAILLWLADRHPGMAPAPDMPERATFLSWLFFTSNTLHAGLRMTFYPENFAGPDHAAQTALLGQMQSRTPGALTLPAALDLLETRYCARPATGGDLPWVTDYYIAALLRWCALYPQGRTGWFRLADWPALASLTRRLEPRAAVQAAIRAEGLGPAPFSAPHYAVPPEGSAT